MTERREDLSTADLAAQQPTDTAPPDRAAPPDVQRREPPDEEFRREDLAAEERERGTTVVQDQGPATTPVGASAAEAVPDSRTAGSASTTGPLLAAEDAEGFRARWTDIQTGFVDAPRRAVEQADALVAELMQHLAGPSPMSGEGWRATGTGVTTSPPTTFATPSSATVPSSSGSSPPDASERSARVPGGTPFLLANVWRGQAEHLADSLSKGDRVMVTGRLRQRSWETPEGISAR